MELSRLSLIYHGSSAVYTSQEQVDRRHVNRLLTVLVNHCQGNGTLCLSTVEMISGLRFSGAPLPLSLSLSLSLPVAHP